jgi:hypothetical protein
MEVECKLQGLLDGRRCNLLSESATQSGHQWLETLLLTLQYTVTYADDVASDDMSCKQSRPQMPNEAYQVLMCAAARYDLF